MKFGIKHKFRHCRNITRFLPSSWLDKMSCVGYDYYYSSFTNNNEDRYIKFIVKFSHDLLGHKL